MVSGKYGLNLACMCWKIWARSSLQLLKNIDWKTEKKNKSSLHVNFLV